MIRGKITYRLIPGHPEYRVGDDGSVWSRWRGRGIRCNLGDDWRRLAPVVTRFGYLAVSLCPGRQRRFIHILVLEAFIGPCPAAMECCHADGNRANNALSNLRWDTRKANRADAIRHGTQPRGERVGNSKYAAALIRRIRSEYATGEITQRQLAAKYGVSQPHVCAIIHRRFWKHIR